MVVARKKGTIALTGATGRLGPYVVEELLRQGHSLRLLVRDPKDAEGLFGGWIKKGRIELCKADLVLIPNGDLVKLLEGCYTVVHLAALVDSNLPWETFMLGNFEVTKKLVHDAHRAGVKRFVHASSIAVYGNPRIRPTPESAPLNPVTPYGWSKLFAEDAVRHAGLDWVILRLGVIYGPGIEEGFVSIARMVKTGRMSLIGRGDNRIPLVHAKDVARAMALAVKSPKAVKHAFNVVGEPQTQRNLLNFLAVELGAPMITQSTPKWMAYVAALYEEVRARMAKRKPRLIRDWVRVFSEDRVFDTTLIGKTIGWRPAVSNEAGIRGFVRWLGRRQSAKSA